MKTKKMKDPDCAAKLAIEAIYSQNTNKLKAILASNIDVNAHDSDGYLALNEACRVGSLEMVRLLVEAGADVNKQDWGEYQPIHMAAMFGNTAIVNYLLENGAESNTRDFFGRLPEYIARDRDHIPVIEAIYQFTKNRAMI